MAKQRTVLLLGLSLVVAAGAAWVANNWLQVRQAPLAADTGREVVVAAVNIPYGQKIERQHLSTVNLPKSSVPADSFDDPALVEGKIAKNELLAGDIVREARTVEHLEGSTLAAMIGDKKRAVTVRVNDVIGVAGFLLPGNHVDIIAAKREGKGAATETVLKRIKVLAVDQTARGENDDKPIVVRAVTLEVTPQQAETLVKTTEEGRIQLALRNPLDEEVTVAVAEPEEPKKVEQKPVVRTYSAPRSTYVTVIRGVKESTTKVGL